MKGFGSNKNEEFIAKVECVSYFKNPRTKVQYLKD